MKIHLQHARRATAKSPKFSCSPVAQRSLTPDLVGGRERRRAPAYLFSRCQTGTSRNNKLPRSQRATPPLRCALGDRGGIASHATAPRSSAADLSTMRNSVRSTSSSECLAGASSWSNPNVSIIACACLIALLTAQRTCRSWACSHSTFCSWRGCGFSRSTRASTTSSSTARTGVERHDQSTSIL